MYLLVFEIIAFIFSSAVIAARSTAQRESMFVFF